MKGWRIPTKHYPLRQRTIELSPRSIRDTTGSQISPGPFLKQIRNSRINLNAPPQSDPAARLRVSHRRVNKRLNCGVDPGLLVAPVVTSASAATEAARLARTSGPICSATTAESVTVVLSSSLRFAREISVSESGIGSASCENTRSVPLESLSVILPDCWN